MARRSHRHEETSIPQVSVAGRARRHMRRGEPRKALVTLREACLMDERDASLWTQYGTLLAQVGRVDDAAQALRHALWLRRSAGDAPRARVTERLIDRLSCVRAA